MKPLGPVGIFGASNFPLAFSVAGGDTTSALAAGCTVVVKAHPAHPGTCELVGTAILNAVRRTGMPEGTFSMVHGPSVDVGLAIVRHPLITAIGFTGSFKGGKAIFDEANRRKVPVPVYAEMGSTNPVFVLPRALTLHGEAISMGLAASVTQGVGQFCTNPGIVLLEHSADATAFKAGLANTIEQTPAGIMLTGEIRNNFQKGVEKLLASGVSISSRGQAGSDGMVASASLLEASARSFL